MFKDNCYYYDHGDQDFLCRFPTMEEMEESIRRNVVRFTRPCPASLDGENVPPEDVCMCTYIVDLRDDDAEPFPFIAVCSDLDPDSDIRAFTRRYSGSLCFDISDLVCEYNPDVHAMASAVLDYLRTEIEDNINGNARVEAEYEEISACEEEEANFRQEDAVALKDDANYTNIVIEFTRAIRRERFDIILFHRRIAEYGGRHTGIKTANWNVGFLRGQPISCGSRRNWYVEVPAGCVVELAFVRRDLLARELPVVQAQYPDLRITVKDKAEFLDPIVLKRAALESQKSSLLAQVAKIDAELSTLTT